MRLYENSNLCEILKNRRQESKLSQEQLAEKIGCCVRNGTKNFISVK